MNTKRNKTMRTTGEKSEKATPRLVKAAEIVAREVVRTLPTPKPAAPVVRPTRTPRSATEARALFNALFGDPVGA